LWGIDNEMAAFEYLARVARRDSDLSAVIMPAKALKTQSLSGHMVSPPSRSDGRAPAPPASPGIRREGSAVGLARTSLTPRQKAVLQARLSGKTIKQIAGELDRSVKTIEFHWTVIQARVGFHDIALITQWAQRNGLVQWTVGLLCVLLTGYATAPQPA
jgi:DNA-binding NarL/FixJ family response regulator